MVDTRTASHFHFGNDNGLGPSTRNEPFSSASCTHHIRDKLVRPAWWRLVERCVLPKLAMGLRLYSWMRMRMTPFQLLCV